MTRFVVPLAAVLSAGLLMPQNASAFQIGQPCAGSTLQSCVDFQLTSETVGEVTTYYFAVTYLSSLAADPGVITAVGLYDLNGTPDYLLSDIQVYDAPLGKDWTGRAEEHCHLTGDGVGASLFEGCADADPPPTANGLAIGETVVFSFTSNREITLASFTETGGLGARAHVQSFGDADCSFKVDTRINGQFSGPDEFGGDIDQCGGTTTVPEPMSMLLLGSGLLGVGIVARRRRDGFDNEA